ncbi:hypothetical protein AB6D20_027830 (plasmid) [Vibrio splendidus]
MRCRTVTNSYQKFQNSLVSDWYQQQRGRCPQQRGRCPQAQHGDAQHGDERD